MARLTINDIARKAGVSKTTVSRVLNNRPEVEESTRLNVLKVIEEANFVPNDMAAGLRKRKTNLVGLLTANLKNPWGIEVFQGVLEGLETYNYQLLLYTTNYHSETAESLRALDRLLNNGLADGLIVLLPAFVQEQFNKLSSSGMPIVVVDDTGFVSGVNLPSIGANSYRGALAVTRHLIGLGHRKIAFIGSPLEFRYSQERLEGYKAALVEAGLECDPALVSTGQTVEFEETGYSATQALLALEQPGPAFTAIFAATDLAALGAMRALTEHGLRVPDDISLAGFDDLPRAAYNVPALTTVHQPLHEIGQLAVKMLMEQIEGKPLERQRIELETELIIRGSTRAR
ncbi:MAG TPA: LacI family DNA-binding transcriptional regulator [Chloroflexia bacterium]|nr:LacI family DNA-binding transcriptional regulator [Chloroflexia bacterium]